MELSVLQDLSSWVSAAGHWTDAWQTFHWHLPLDIDFLAQFKQTDLAGDTSKAWNEFVRTGRLWAFLTGLVVGYAVKTFTSFG